MNMRYSRSQIGNGLATLSVLGLIGILAYYLLQPGYSLTRLGFFILIAGTAIIGGFGVINKRPIVTTVGIVGLFLLGFWQAVLSIFIYSVIGILLIAALLNRWPEASTPEGE